MAKKKSSKQKKKFKLIKKIARGVYYFISKIYNIIDKIIITPIAKLILIFRKPFEGTGKSFDRLLNNKNILITVSLVIAFALFVGVSTSTETMMNNSADILYNHPVKATYNEEAYVIEGLPETVDITMIGKRSALYLAKQSAEKEVVIDLKDLKAGTHKVNLKYNGTIPNVEYKLNPSVATVVIYEKMSESKKITKEVLFEDKLDSKFNISNITFNRDEVYVKGAEAKLEQVAAVKALVDLRKITNPTIGTTTLKDIPLVAYDSNGQKLDVEIVPETIDASIEIKSPSKEVPLKVVPEGNVVFGKAIEQISLNKTTATIYGDQEALDKISNIPININVDGITKTTEYNINVSLPSGVKEISTKSVVVKVTLDDVAEKTIDNVNIATRNLANGLTAQAASKNDSVASVIVKGTKSNIKDITAENITAYVDLQGLSAGTHKVNVQVTGEDVKLTYTPKTQTVTIVIK